MAAKKKSLRRRAKTSTTRASGHLPHARPGAEPWNSSRTRTAFAAKVRELENTIADLREKLHARNQDLIGYAAEAQALRERDPAISEVAALRAICNISVSTARDMGLLSEISTLSGWLSRVQRAVVISAGRSRRLDVVAVGADKP